MKKLIATVLSALLLLTISLPSLQSFFPDSDGYIDRNILCRWIVAAKGDRLMLDTVAHDESICPGEITAGRHYQYGKNCVSRCDVLAIADQIVKAAEGTAAVIKERVKLILASRPLQ